MKSVKIGIIQESPIYLDVEKSMQKAIRLIEDAVEQGAKLIVFGETWLSGYPVWLDHCPNMALWDQASTKEVFTQMHLNSIEVPGKETEIFGALAKQYGVVIVIGVNEIVRKKGHALGTIYNALLTFDEQGNLANHHRKLMPTFTAYWKAPILIKIPVIPSQPCKTLHNILIYALLMLLPDLYLGDNKK